MLQSRNMSWELHPPLFLFFVNGWLRTSKNNIKPNHALQCLVIFGNAVKTKTKDNYVTGQISNREIFQNAKHANEHIKNKYQKICHQQMCWGGG